VIGIGEQRHYTEAEKQNVVEQIWLNYFNQTLFEKGLISEKERNRMKLKIESRKPKAQDQER